MSRIPRPTWQAPPWGCAAQTGFDTRPVRPAPCHAAGPVTPPAPHLARRAPSGMSRPMSRHAPRLTHAAPGRGMRGKTGKSLKVPRSAKGEGAEGKRPRWVGSPSPSTLTARQTNFRYPLGPPVLWAPPMRYPCVGTSLCGAPVWVWVYTGLRIHSLYTGMGMGPPLWRAYLMGPCMSGPLCSPVVGWKQDRPPRLPQRIVLIADRPPVEAVVRGVIEQRRGGLYPLE